jgi:hypothetical protein
MIMLRIKTILLLALLLTVAPDTLFAQRARGIDLEGGIRSSLDLMMPASFYLSGKYAWWRNPHFAYTVGVGFSYVPLNRFPLSFVRRGVRYHIDNNVVNLFAATGLRFVTPAFRNIGLMADADFVFEPIPFLFASISSYDFRYGHIGMSRTSLVYTRFNPSYNIQISAFYNFTRGGSRGRLAVGFGLDSYNPLNTYYRATVNDIRLRDHVRLRSERMNFSVFLRLSNVSL